MPSKSKAPGSALRERSILFGFAVQKKSLDGRVQIGIRWGRLGAAVVALALLSWLGLSAALYLHFKHNREYSEASFSKMLILLPSIPFGGLERHRTEMGDFHIEKGLQEMQAGNYRDALRLLRLGVARSPRNLEGRRMLADFYDVAIKRPDIAADQLIKGLEFGGSDNVDYLKQTLQTLLKHQMDSKIQEIADTYLPGKPEPTERNRTLAFGAAKANHLRGNYDRADDYLIDFGLIDSLEGLLLSAQISWDRGNQISAITKMESSLSRFPNSEPLLMQLSRYHRELDQFDEARRYAILRNMSDPMSAAPRIELLYIFDETGDEARETAEIQRMLRQFRDNESALLALTNFAADTGKIDLARKTYEEALENGFSIGSFALLLIEAHLASEDYQGALNFSEELLKEGPDWLTDRWAVFSSLRAVASYGANRPDLGEIYLQDFISDSTNKPNTYLAVSRRFEKINRIEQARKVLLSAYEKSPSNQRILSDLIRAELRLGYTENLNRLISRLLKMRRPDPELLLEAYRKLGSDRFIFTPDRENLLLELSAILRENTQTREILSTAADR